MNKEEILNILALKDVKTLESLYKLTLHFTEEEIISVAKKMQSKETRVLIKSYL